MEPTPSGPEPVPIHAAVAGGVAAGVALAITELASGLDRDIPSLVVAIGDVVVDHAPFQIVEGAISFFGTNDKTALVVGTVVLALAFGAVLGVATRRRWWIGPVGFACFGAAGVLAADRVVGASPGLAAITTAVAVAGGLLALAALLGAARRGRVRPPPDALPFTAQRVESQALAARRAFLGLAAGGVGVAVLGGWAGGRLRRRFHVENARDRIVLPRPVRSDPGIEAAALDVEGLTPLVTPNDRFYRIDTAILVPQVEPDDWSLRITGRVAHPYELTYAELLELPMVEEYVTLACVSNEVGGDLVGTAKWLGVPLADILERAGPRKDADQIVGRSIDRFTVGFPTAAATDGRVALVAVGMNGEPLPVRHGFPARLVVSGLYGYVSATKWLSEIELTRWDDFDAYWIPRGWSKEAPIKTQARIDTPANGRVVLPGTVPVAGVAWAPHRGIASVEVQIDGGAWEPAELSGQTPDDAWRQWLYAWNVRSGTHTIRVRATDGTGETQSDVRRPPAPDGATGLHEVTIRVDEG